MAFVDFEYAGRYLSDFGFMVCSFNSNDIDTISNGSTLTLNTVPVNNGSKFLLTSSKYDECISSTFSICKNVCDNTDLSITVEENSRIMRWLNRKNFNKFKIVDDYYSNIYFNSTFNVNRVVIGGKLVGYELQMLTDSPFGYKEPVEHSFAVSPIDVETNTPKIILDTSDEIGFIYPRVEINMFGEGTLTIRNELDGNRITEIKNCEYSDNIIMDYPMIDLKSNINNSNIMNSFNYNFLRIVNSYDERVNRLFFSLPCSVKITYSPICKVVI